MMTQTLNNRTRYSSTKRFTAKPDQPLPPVLSDRQRIQFILTAVENVCFKLERCMDNQNQKIKTIETKLSDTLAEKFQKLIEVNERVAKLMQRNQLRTGLRVKAPLLMEEDKTGKEVEKVSPHISPVNPIRRAESIEGADKQTLTAEQSIIPQTVTTQKQQISAVRVLERKDSMRRNAESTPTNKFQRKDSLSKKNEQVLPVRPAQKEILKKLDLPVTPQVIFEIDSPTPVRSPSHSLPIILLSNELKQVKPLKLMPVPELNKPISTIVRQPLSSKDEFISQLMFRMRDFHSDLAQTLYTEFSRGLISYRDLKIRYSWQIMNFYFDINKDIHQGPYDVIGNLNNRMYLTKLIDKTTRSILEFLIKKYPPSKNKIADTQLSNHIMEINRTSDLSYDILRNAKMNFTDNNNRRDFTRDIKKWLNILINQTKEVYPNFKRTIKDIFIDGDNSLMGEQFELEYEIGRKINETTTPYTDDELNMPGLQLKAPELLRILVKWMGELMNNFLQSDKKIIQNKSGFKSVTRGLTISLTLKRKELLAETLRNIYKEDIQKRISNRERHMYNIINQLMTMALAGYKGYEYLNEREVLIGKISQHFSQCSETYTLKMLNNLLAGLNKTRVKYENQLLESSLDLVTFSVMDLLRCKCVGSRQQILRIYKQIQKRKDDFQIVRVKNKLNESTRDILINFRYRKSFLICQMQLALGDSKDQVNDHFCHNLYEMQRSVFPVLFQNANQLVNLDTRTAYFDSSRVIEFRANPKFTQDCLMVEGGQIFCVNSHEPYEMIFHSNSAPYCCSYCSKFVGSYTFSLEYLRCYKCMACICPKCLLIHCQQFMLTYINRNEKITEINEFVHLQPYYSGFGRKKEVFDKVKQALSEQISRYVIVNQFDKRGLRTNIYKLFDGQVVNSFCTIEEIKPEDVLDSPDNWNIIWIPAKPLTLKLTELKLYHKYCHLGEYPWYKLQEIIAGTQQAVCVLNSEQKKVIILDIIEDPAKITQVLNKARMLRHIEDQNKKAELNLQLTTKELTGLEILSYVDRKSMVKSLNLWQNRLVTVKELKEFTGIQDLNLRENMVQSIREVFYLVNLQYLDLHNNRLAGRLPKMDFPSLKTLDLSQNLLTDISSLSESSLPLLVVLFVSHNKLKEVPVLVCPMLEVYFFSHNQVQNLQNFTLSRIPKIRKIYGFNNKIYGELPDICFPCLEAILLEDNKIQGISALAKWSLPTLEYINLSSNCIVGGLPAITSLTNLKKIDLSNNKLTDIQNIQLSVMDNICEIDLSANCLEGQLPRFSFKTLQKFVAGFNKFSNITLLQSCQLPSLSSLSLNGNIITDLPILCFPQLKHIDLSNNNIISLIPLTEWRLPQIEIIQLNSNAIHGVVPLLIFDRLQQLHLDSNDITEINCLKEKQLIPQIRVISVRNNKTQLLEGGCLVMNSSRMFHRAMSGIWKLRQKPANYSIPDNLQ